MSSSTASLDLDPNYLSLSEDLLVESTPTPLSKDLELEALEPVPLPADALIEIAPEPPAAPAPRANPFAIDLRTAVLGSKAWEAALCEDEPVPLPPATPIPTVAPVACDDDEETGIVPLAVDELPDEDPWPADNEAPLCPDLAGLRFDAPAAVAAPQPSVPLAVPYTPPPSPRPVAEPRMAREQIRPLPEIVHVRPAPGAGARVRDAGAPTVTGVGASPRKPRPRAPSPVPGAGLRRVVIKERTRSQDLSSQDLSSQDVPRKAPPRVDSSARGRKADMLYQEALKAMAQHDYAAADRHLTLALTFAPGDPRLATARSKVRRVLNL